MWDSCWLFPDADHGWKAAALPILGVPALARMLVALKRGGIDTVHIADGAQLDRTAVERWSDRWDLPQVRWQPREEETRTLTATAAPRLAIRWGVMFSPRLVQWLRASLDHVAPHPARIATGDGLTIMVRDGLAQDPAADTTPSTLVVPDDIPCWRLEELLTAGGGRALLDMVGKPTDRWHVEWVRRWSFGGMQWLAARHITPNQVTVLGFAVAILACMLIARGQYWSGIFGAMLLYASWVLDCMDGTLARLTFAESPFGQKLDTVLGHITNLAIFAALIWAVYGHDRWWKAALSGIFMLGGILMAYRMSETEKRLRRVTAVKPSHAGLERFLDKINHRDYAVVIFVLAVLGGFKWFLWISLVGVHVFWLIHLWLIHQRKANVE